MNEQLDTRTGWLSGDELQNIRANVPLVYVDAVPVRVDDLGRVTQYHTDPDLAETLVTKSAETVHWISQKVVKFFPKYGRQAFKHEGRFKFFTGFVIAAVGGGRGLVDAYFKACDKNGVDVRYNAQAIGLVLYTKYAYLFQTAGLVLLVAMIGAIVLTFRSRPGVRRQKIGTQVGRRVEDSVELRKVKSREGV